MTRRSTAKAVRAVSILRGLQEDAALGRVEAAGRVTRRLEALQTAERARQDERQEGWTRSLSLGGVALTGLWSAAIQGGEVELTGLAERRALAQSGQDAARDDWREATARAEAARDLAKVTERQFARAAEERMMAEIADRSARRGRRR